MRFVDVAQTNYVLVLKGVATSNKLWQRNLRFRGKVATQPNFKVIQTCKTGAHVTAIVLTISLQDFQLYPS